ncbi:Methionine--tRNA ligase [Chlamydiales bacterium SCGC AG-110-P3]|nr:Methionine--tRNA ligase [Chlamydiales bacterium SCGC AG-110-P3]
MTQQRILITSALPYANGPLHFGHIAGAYLPGDVYARFERLCGNDVLYVCGSDEYGVAITMSAELAGRTPKEHVDVFHTINKELFKRLDFTFDHYSRTTCEAHAKPVCEFFHDLHANGYIEERITDQLYSEADDKFLADRYVTGTCPKCGYDSARGDECPKCGAAYETTDLINPRSKLTNSSLSLRPTKHWFLLLDKFKGRLLEWLETKNWKSNVVNFVRDYIDNLHPRAITRDSKWGIPVPLDNAEGKVLYVWFDAPIGYISATQEWAQKQGAPDRWKDYWQQEETKLVHFIGKDNIPFHAAIFPAMVMGQNQPYKLVDELPANEFYNLEGKRFSKSEGWYIDLHDFFERYTADQIRYAIAANAPETADSEFTWHDFQQRCNSDLVGKYGNFVNRTLVFAQKQCAGVVPSRSDFEAIDETFLAEIDRLTSAIADAYATFRLRRACRLVMELAQTGNVYFDHKKPWKDAKEDALHPRMRTTIALCLHCAKALAVSAAPIIPAAAQHVWALLGQTGSLDQQSWMSALDAVISEGQELPKPVVIFQKVEDAQIDQEIEKLNAMSREASSVDGSNGTSYEPLKDAVDIDAVRKLDLRVAVIIAAERVRKSKKLLKLTVDLGFETRTVVSGISQHYEPDQLVGRKVVVVANLKPAKLMGVESQGMILAGVDNSSLEVVGIEDLPAGAVVS